MALVHTNRLTRGSGRRLLAFLFGMVRSRGTSLLWAETRYEARVPWMGRCLPSGHLKMPGLWSLRDALEQLVSDACPFESGTSMLFPFGRR